MQSYYYVTMDSRVLAVCLVLAVVALATAEENVADKTINEQGMLIIDFSTWAQAPLIIYK